MPDWLPLSRTGGGLAALYIAFAMWVVFQERTQVTGGWISLRGMGSVLVTAPFSLAMEMLGWKVDYRRNIDMGLAIIVCAMLVYLVGAALAALISLVIRGLRP